MLIASTITEPKVQYGFKPSTDRLFGKFGTASEEDRKKRRTPAEAAGIKLNVSTFGDLIKIATKIVY